MLSLGKMKYSRAPMQNNIIARRVSACSKNNIMFDFFCFLLAFRIQLLVPLLVSKSLS